MTAGHKVIFAPSGLRAVAGPGETVLDVAHRAGVDLQSICGGRGLCGRCQIEVASGAHAKFAVTACEAHLSAPGEAEARAARRGVLHAGRRLACRAQILGDVVIDVPADSQVHGAIMAKAGTAIDLPLIPPVRLIMVTVPRPALDDNPADAESLIAALGIDAQIDATVLPRLQPLLAANERTLIVVLRDDSLIIDLWAPGVAHVYGAALDIGSTSLALYIYDL